MISEKLQKGQLLIAEPSILGDLFFNRSVILLAEHSNEGSLGFIMNKPLEYTINDLVPDIEASFKIYNESTSSEMDGLVLKFNKSKPKDRLSPPKLEKEYTSANQQNQNSLY